MSRTLTISDAAYERLRAEAGRRGVSVEQLIEGWKPEDDEGRQWRDAADRAEEIQERLYARYGEMPDSTPLIRDDRER